MGESLPGRTYQTTAIVNARFLDLLLARGIGAFTRTHYYVDRLIARGHLYVPRELANIIDELYENADNCNPLLKIIGVFENDSHRVIQLGLINHPELGKIGNLLLPKGTDLSLIKTAPLKMKTDQYYSNAEPYHDLSDGSLTFELAGEHNPESTLMIALRELEQKLTSNLPVKLVLRRKHHDFLHMERQEDDIPSILEGYGPEVSKLRYDRSFAFALEEWSVGLPGHSEIEVGKVLLPHGISAEEELELMLVSRAFAFFNRELIDDIRCGRLHFIHPRIKAYLDDPVTNPLDEA